MIDGGEQHIEQRFSLVVAHANAPTATVPLPTLHNLTRYSLGMSASCNPIGKFGAIRVGDKLSRFHEIEVVNRHLRFLNSRSHGESTDGRIGPPPPCGTHRRPPANPASQSALFAPCCT